MASMTASPIPSTSKLQQPRITLRPTSSTSSINSTHDTPTPTPGPSRPNSEDQDELQEVRNASSLPTSAEKEKGGKSNHTPLMTTTAMRAPGMSAMASGSGSGTYSPSPKSGNQTVGGKSRKSSCLLCHQRKIKCDQLRPSCSSCTRKGHTCKYAEEAEQYYHPSSSTSITRQNQNQRAMSVTIVNASDPSIKYTMPVPGSNSITSTPSLKVGYGQNNNLPEWKTAETNNTPNSSVNVNGNGSAEKKKSADRRERIVSGFDSDSEDELNGDQGQSEESSVQSKSRGKGKDEDNLKDLDGELAALVDDEGEDKDKEEDVDELEDDEKEGSIESDDKDRKRGIAVDDEISGELLELASAPPKKKKKPTTSVPVGSLNFSRPKTVPGRYPHGRTSLPAGVLPPTPATSTTPLTLTNRMESTRFDPYSTPLQNLANSLPSPEMQQILFNTFFTDPFLTEGISLLQPQYMDDFKGLLERRSTRFQAGDATTLANAFLFLATALRILPDETSKLLLASQAYPSLNQNTSSQFPRSLSKIISCQPSSSNDMTPLDQRYLDLALISTQIAEQADPPSVMLVMLKLVLYRFCMLGHRKDKIVLAGMWLAQAVKIAQALGMGKEWEGLTQGERELRRRVMWSLYVADRHHSFETSFPYTIMDAHQGIHLPSPMSENDLYKLRPDIRELPAHSTEIAPTSCTALFIHTHLARRITPILDSFATISAANTPQDLVLRFDSSLDSFQEALPSYFKLFPLTETKFDSTNQYLLSHRIKLHSTLLSYRLGVHRTHLLSYLQPNINTANNNGGIRKILIQVCLSNLKIQKTTKLLDSKISFRLFNPMTIFENSTTLALIMYVEKFLNVSSGDLQHYLRSGEWLTMRNGLSKSIELLDNVIPGEGQTYSRRAVHILRELMLKLDTPIRPLHLNQVSDSPLTQPHSNPLTHSHPYSQPHQTFNPKTEREKSTSTSPRSNEKHSGISISPEKSTSNHTNDGNLHQPPPQPPLGQPFNPYVQKLNIWLDEIRKSGVNLEILLREPEWINGWERIVGGM